MLNNVYLTDINDICNENINFNNNKDKIIFNSIEDSNIIYKVDDFLFPVIKYKKYKLESKTTLTHDADLILNPAGVINVLKDGENILKLKNVDYFNLNSRTLDAFDLEYDKIYYNIIYSTNTFKYCYKIKIKLHNCDLYMNISNILSLIGYNWHKTINLYILKNNIAIEFSLLKLDDLIDFVKKYCINNKELEQFLKYLNFYNFNYDNYTINDFINDLKVNINNHEKPLKIGTKKMNKIETGLLRYFSPIIKDDLANVYLKYYGGLSYSNVFYTEYLKDNLSDEEIEKCEILVRESKSIIQYLNNYSKIDIYTGKILDDDYEQLYIDNSGLIVKNKRSIYNSYYYIKINNIWVSALHDEINEISNRYSLIKSLTL